MKTTRNSPDTVLVAFKASGNQLARERLAKSLPAILLDALSRAEAFMSGFEDDEGQVGVVEDLEKIRAAMALCEGTIDALATSSR